MKFTDWLGASGEVLSPVRLDAGVRAALVILFLSAVSAVPAGAYEGKVIDASTRRPIAGAIVTLADISVRTLADGSFRIKGAGQQIHARAQGYSRRWVATVPFREGKLVISLRRFSPRAVFLSLSTLDDPGLREAVARLPGTTHINALVIDVKDEQGDLVFPSPGPNGVRRPDRSRDVQALVGRLHRNGRYAIARISVFKDEWLARTRPTLALKSADGFVVRDNDGKAWTDPRDKAVRDYNIGVAIEAARQGFDEIQFDFVRFPSVTQAPRLTDEVRRAAIRGFLSEARAALTAYNVFMAADVYGYASWDPGDTNIGQKLEDIATKVDYVCLMLYPSSFKHGLPTARKPLDRPDRIVDLSLRRARQRTGLPAVRFRPWLQAFPDYSFDRRPFRRREIGAQVYAAERFGANGWMLFHPHSVYVATDLPTRSVRAGRVRP